jgi:predicted permease
MPPTTPPGFLDQTIGRLVYAIIPLNIFLTVGYGATSLEAHEQRSFWLCIVSLVFLVLFWGISTVRLIARRHRKNRWRLVALTPPTVILATQAFAGNEPVGFLAGEFLIWLLASLSLAFMPDAPSHPAVHGQ